MQKTKAQYINGTFMEIRSIYVFIIMMLEYDILLNIDKKLKLY